LLAVLLQKEGILLQAIQEKLLQTYQRNSARFNAGKANHNLRSKLFLSQGFLFQRKAFAEQSICVSKLLFSQGFSL
jgi:hypothetical protein